MLARKYLLTLFVAVAALVAAPAWAQDEADLSLDSADEAAASAEESEDEEADSKKKKKSKKKSKKAKTDAKAEESPVAAALKKLKTLQGRPNMKADFYVYMCSASFCRYCSECMPVAVAESKKMKRGNVEFILISGEGSKDAAKKYLKGYRAKCPVVLMDELKGAKFQNLPGSSSAIGLPAAAIVTKEGKVLSSGLGASSVKNILTSWKSVTEKAREEAEKTEE